MAEHVIDTPDIDSAPEGVGEAVVLGLGQRAIVVMEAQDAGSACRYDLSPDELSRLEAQLLGELAERGAGERDVYCVWVDSRSEYANIARTHETTKWKYIPAIMADKECSSEFLIVVDTRDPEDEGVKRVSRITFVKDTYVAQGLTGMAIVDDVIRSNQGLTFDDVIGYYAELGVDITKCFSVETNVKVKKAEKYKGLHLADIGYLAMFHKIDELREGGLSYIFSTINRASIESFERIDLRAEPLAGRPDIQTPAADGEFDENFVTVALPTTEHNLGIFQMIESLSAPEIHL